MENLTIREFMARIPEYFVPEKAKGVDAVTQFHLTGEGGGDWIVTIKDQQCTVAEGVATNPKLVVTADSQDIMKIMGGKMDPMRAFMQGKIRFIGDMSLAMKLANLFSVR